LPLALAEGVMDVHVVRAHGIPIRHPRSAAPPSPAACSARPRRPSTRLPDDREAPGARDVPLDEDTTRPQ